MEKTVNAYRQAIVDIKAVQCGFAGCTRTVLVDAAYVVHLKHIKQFEGTHWSQLTLSQISQAGACFCPQHKWWPIQQKLELRPLPVTVNFLVSLREERAKAEEAKRAAESQMRARFTIAQAVEAGCMKPEKRRRRAG